MSRQTQHVVMFMSSRNNKELVHPNEFTDVFNLSVSLRSTCEISNFANTWLKTSELFDEIELKIGHNFSGEKPDICIVPQEHNRNSDVGTAFVEKCASIIEENLHKSSDSDILPVLIDIPKDSLDLLEAILTSKNCSTQRGLTAPSDKQLGECRDLPTACFFQFDEVEGAEFSTVVVLTSWRNHKSFENPCKFCLKTT